MHVQHAITVYIVHCMHNITRGTACTDKSVTTCKDCALLCTPATSKHIITRDRDMAAFADRAVLQDLTGDIFKLVVVGSSARQWAEWLRVPLEHAARNGDIDLVKTLLRSGADGSAGWRGSCDGGTLLGAGALGGNEGVVAALLEAGSEADINVQLPAHRNGFALHVAVARGAEGAARALMVAGADVNGIDEDGRAPLHLAAESGYDRLVGGLLLRGALPDQADISGDTPLHLAAREGHTRSISVLLMGGANRDVLNLYCHTPLYSAVDANHLQAAERLLLTQGDEKYPHLELFRTLVERAAENGHLDMLRMLMSQGGDLAEGQVKPLILNPLLLIVAGQCSIRNNACIIKYLIEGGADTDFRSIGGFTALLLAASKTGPCHEDILALLREGAGVNARNQADMTALHFACRRSNVVALEILLRWGADEALISDDGRTAMDEVGFDDCGNEADDGRIRRMLARAPADRSWRRRSWLVLCRSCPDRVNLTSGTEPIADSGEGRIRGDGLAKAAKTDRNGDDSVKGDEEWGEGGGDEAMAGLRRVVAWMVGLEEYGIFRRVVGYL